MNPHQNRPEPDDIFVQQLEALDESFAVGEIVSHDDPTISDGSVVELGELADCIRLIERVRQHSPDCIADFVQEDSAGSPWMDGGDEHPAKIGRFVIRRKLGQGGFGLVFLALDPELQREVALKVPRVEALVTEQTRERFLREGKAAASLNHPNIATVYESGRIGPICYIASTYCAGGSLAEFLKGRRRLAPHDRADPPGAIDPRTSALVVLALTDAVQHAHSRGILHRDLKPSNILFDAAPAGDRDLVGSARLVDFGLAKTLDSDEDHTRTGVLLGTPAYVSPEQAAGDPERIAATSDIYSIGAILYELVTGAPPLRKPTDQETLVALATEEPTPLSRIARGCSKDLDAICLKCLEKSPDRRYRSAAELSDDLQRFLNGDPVVARPITRRERWIRWRRRNPVLSLLTAAVLLLTGLLIVGSTTAAVMLMGANKTSLKRLADAIDAEREATQSKQLAIGALYEAYKSESRALRFSGQVGQSLDSLEAIENAARRIPQLGLSDRERLELRNGAIASLALDDLRLEERWPVSNSSASDLDGENYVVWLGGRDFSVRRMSNNAEVARLESSTVIRGHRVMRFSRDGHLISVRFLTKDGILLNVWRIDGAELIRVVRLANFPINAFDLSPDSSRLAIVHPDGSIGLLSGQDFQASRKLPGQTPARAVRFSPSGSKIVVVRARQADILDVDTGEVLQSFAETFLNLDYSAVAWSPNERFVAAACSDRTVRIWNAQTGTLHSHLVGHGGEVAHISFHPAGRLIATASHDGKTKLWSVEDGRELLEADAKCTHFSRDGRWLCGGAARWRFFDTARYFQQFDLLWHGIHPNGRVAVAYRHDTSELVDTRSGRLVDSAIFQGHALFNKSGSRLLVAQRNSDGRSWTILRRHVECKEDDSRITMKIGPPEEITRVSWLNWEWAVGESMLALADYYRGTIRMVNIETGEVHDTEFPHSNTRWMDWSQNDSLLATGTWHGRDVKVWERDSGKLLASHPSRNARVRFSPDAQTLVTGEHQRFTFRPVDGAGTGRVTAVERVSVSAPSPIGFSPDGSIVALAEKFRAVRLFDTTTLSTLATMTVDAGDEIDHVEFSPDGSQLLVRARRSSYVWNLRNVRARLSTMGLDWNAMPLVEAARSPAKEVQVEIDSSGTKVH